MAVGPLRDLKIDEAPRVVRREFGGRPVHEIEVEIMNTRLI